MSITPALLEEFLAHYPTLQQLPTEALQELQHKAQLVDVPAGMELFNNQQACKGFPFILNGSVKVCKSTAQGRELPLYRVTPGETCIISSSCLLGRTLYNAKGSTEVETRILLLSDTIFENWLSYPVFRQFVFNLFSERVADLMQLVEEVAFRKLDQRLALILLGKGRLLHTTHQQLADELGSVREMVSRLLKGFAEHGWVKLGREQIEILNPSALRDLASV